MSVWATYRRNGLGVVLAVLGGASVAGCQFDTRAAAYTDDGNNPPPDGGDDAPPDGPVEVAPADCPNDYLAVPGAPGTSKYKLRNSKETWADARTICAFEADENAVSRTHLVTLETPAEFDAIATLYDTDEHHLGLTRVNQDAQWEWVTAEIADMDLVPWAQGEPESYDFCAQVDELDGPQGSGGVMRVYGAGCLRHINANLSANAKTV
ncbi:MAG: C-type lectin domain-containing protein [Myxococcales bacterium]|nr:C-type lectin domain-containing protein [Myxococcales bacterium]